MVKCPISLIKQVLSLTLAASDWGIRLEIPALHEEALALNEAIFANEELSDALEASTERKS